MNLKHPSRWKFFSRVLIVLGLLLLLPGAALPENAEIPAPAAPAKRPGRVLVFGDSIMRALGRSLNLELARQPEVRAHVFSSLGSGLARLDVFDWMAKIEEMIAEFHPDSAIVMLGTNDAQPMKTPSDIVRPGTDAWNAEYSRRLEEVMDRLHRGGVARVFWIGLPDMRTEKLHRETTVINDLIRKAAATRSEWVTLLDSREVLSIDPGTYSPFVIQSDGMPLQVRNADGIHLSRRGADLLAAWIVKTVMSADVHPE